MNKVLILLLVFLSLIVSACGQATLAPVVEVATQAPLPTQEEVVQPTEVPTKAPTNTPAPTPIPPTPTEEPKEETSVFVSSGVKPEDLVDKDTVMEILSQDMSVRQFSNELMAGSLLWELEEDGPFTIFAPTYEFSDIPEGTFTAPDQFKSALVLHIVPGLYLAADLLTLDGQSLPTLSDGGRIQVTVKDGIVYLNNLAVISKADILARNGVIHVIDQFLLPPGE